MTFKSFLIYNTFAISVAFLFLAYSPLFLDVNPKAYSLNFPEKFEKGLAYNERLSAADPLLQNQIVGPESLAYHKGAIYTGLHNGDIIKIEDGRIMKTFHVGKAGESRPLGIRIDKKGLLYFVDGFNGLRTLDLKTEKVTTLLAQGTEIDGTKVNFLDDLDIDENGVIYMSDGSTRWNLHQLLHLILEHDNSGRVIAYDTKTGKSLVLADNMHFSNGIQLTHNKQALLVAENLKSRIIKIHLQGPKKGQKEVFANLPGEPDNIRLSKRGGYWVAFAAGRNTSSTTVFDCLAKYPVFRKVLSRLIHLAQTASGYVSKMWSPALPPTIDYNNSIVRMSMKLIEGSALIVELNENGEIVQSLHSSDPRWSWLSEVLEENGYLYLGSFINPHLGKVKL